ncbi:HEPN domain-containing protein [Bartonella sp. LJL80]
MMDEKLEHLPQSKQRMVKLMLDTILHTFQQQFEPSPYRSTKDAKIVRVILYGSHARGGYVNDNTSGYHSDYDFCILLNNTRFKNPKYWHGVEEALINIPSLSASDHSSPGLVIHGYKEMNAKLRDGWPFYVDIVNDGITLYELEGYPFSPIGPLKPKRRKVMAERWFHEYIEEADKFLKMASLAREQGDKFQNLAAFHLHQATETLYHCVLLTLKLYAPKLHDLKKLHQKAVNLVPELKDLWPIHDRRAERAFERLYDAYVKGRYSRHYEITNEELDWLESRIKLLREKVVAACEKALAAK